MIGSTIMEVSPNVKKILYKSRFLLTLSRNPLDESSQRQC